MRTGMLGSFHEEKAVLAMSIIAMGLMTTACLTAPDRLPPCDSWDTESSICGLMNPEDLDFWPGSEWIAVSEMTHDDSATSDAAEDEEREFVSGRLTAVRVPLDAASLPVREKLFPRVWAEVSLGRSRWGDPECPGPPTLEDFQPHGLDVGPGPEGDPILAVVTHGVREVVDLFSILPGDLPGVEWRGCVEVPESVMANDVALFDGGFVLTNMLPRFEEIGAKALWSAVEMSFGAQTGSVLRWTRDDGFEEVPESAGSAPNGIAVTPSGQTLFFAEWAKGRVTRLRLRPGKPPLRDSVDVEGSPDNLTWAPDGSLIVASQQAGVLRALGCGGRHRGGCDVGYAITRIDPETLEATVIDTGRGAASAAVDLGFELWIGYFSGDSITRVRPTEE